MVFIAITGRPGVGKSTVFFKVIDSLKSCGVKICGFYCPEVREGGRRIGFRIVDIVTGSSGWLALSLDKVDREKLGQYKRRVGRYVVVEDQACKIGIEALDRCIEADLVAIDELGPMELSLEALRKRIIEVLSSAKNALLVVHRNLRDREILRVLNSKETRLYTVTEANRSQLPTTILSQLSMLCRVI